MQGEGLKQLKMILFDCYCKTKKNQRKAQFTLPLICADFLENTKSRNPFQKTETMGKMAKEIKEKVKKTMKESKNK